MAKKCRHRSRTYPNRKNKKQRVDCAYGKETYLYKPVIEGESLYDPDTNPLTEGESNTVLTDEAERDAWAKLVGKENVKKMANIIRGGNH